MEHFTLVSNSDALKNAIFIFFIVCQKYDFINNLTKKVQKSSTPHYKRKLKLVCFTYSLQICSLEALLFHPPLKRDKFAICRTDPKGQ